MQNKGVVAMVVALGLGVGVQEGAWAFVKTPKTLAYTAHDLVINQILQGPIGFVGDAALKADAVVTSMGALPI